MWYEWYELYFNRSSFWEIPVVGWDTGHRKLGERGWKGLRSYFGAVGNYKLIKPYDFGAV